MAEREEREIILTKEGLQKLETELEHLKSFRREEVAERIKQAIAFGDISENSEYEDAKKEQAFIEGEIARLEEILRTAKIIDRKEITTSVVSIGSVVHLQNMDTKEKVEYRIVGSTEADPTEGRISHVSPVGAALSGKKKGETVDVQAPKGMVTYKVLNILRGMH